MTSRPVHTAPSSSRRGGVMFMTLATLAVVSLIVVAMVRGAIIARRSLRGEQALRQVELLLDAAEARAATRVSMGQAVDETIDLSPADLGGQCSARVIVTSTPSDTTDLRLEIVAEYPCEGPVTVRRTREAVIRSPVLRPTDPVTDKESSP